MVSAGTVANWFETNLNPTQEVVVLEGASNGEVYTSRKFNTIQGGHITQNGPSTSGSVSLSVSGTSATIYASTSGTFTLVLYGE